MCLRADWRFESGGPRSSPRMYKNPRWHFTVQTYSHLQNTTPLSYISRTRIFFSYGSLPNNFRFFRENDIRRVYGNIHVLEIPNCRWLISRPAKTGYLRDFKTNLLRRFWCDFNGDWDKSAEEVGGITFSIQVLRPHVNMTSFKPCGGPARIVEPYLSPI